MFLKLIRKKFQSFTLLETTFSVVFIGLVMSMSIGTYITFQGAQKELNNLVAGYENLRVIMDFIYRSLKTGYKFSNFQSGDTTSDLVFVRGDGYCVRINATSGNLYFYTTSSNDYSPCNSLNINDQKYKVNIDNVTINSLEFHELGCDTPSEPRLIRIYLNAKINSGKRDKGIIIETLVTPRNLKCQQ